MTWISHGCTCVPSSWTLLIPLGCPRAPALGPLLHASNWHWSSILHMAMYMFWCYSVKSSYIVLLPLSLKVCSSCWCLLCCAACRIIGNWYISVSIPLLCEKGKVRNPRASNILSKWCQSCPHLFHSYPIGGNWSCGHTLLQRRVGNVGCSKAAS